jgi:ribonuclease HI
VTGRIVLNIFADASYHRQHRTAGWGAVMEGDRTEVEQQMGGQIKELVDSSSEAEMRALANALAIALRRGYVQEGETFMVQSDSTNALGWILRVCPRSSQMQVGSGARVTRPGSLKLAAARSSGLEIFRQLCEEHRLHVIVCHVRAHQGGDTARSHVNERCDQIAKLHHAQRLKAHQKKIRHGALRGGHDGAGAQEPGRDQDPPAQGGRGPDRDV